MLVIGFRCEIMNFFGSVSKTREILAKSGFLKSEKR